MGSAGTPRGASASGLLMSRRNIALIAVMLDIDRRVLVEGLREMRLRERTMLLTALLLKAARY